MADLVSIRVPAIGIELFYSRFFGAPQKIEMTIPVLAGVTTMHAAFPRDFVPRKTVLGAHLIATHDAGLGAGLRRLLLLADGRRTIFTLCQMLPDLNAVEDLAELIDKGLLEDSRLPPESHSAGPSGKDPRLPDGWDTATDFMVGQARETLGVAAVDVIEALEHANDTESARQAISQWYRALRTSREGREFADTARLRASSMLHG